MKCCQDTPESNLHQSWHIIYVGFKLPRSHRQPPPPTHSQLTALTSYGRPVAITHPQASPTPGGLLPSDSMAVSVLPQLMILSYLLNLPFTTPTTDLYWGPPQTPRLSIKSPPLFAALRCLLTIPISLNPYLIIYSFLRHTVTCALTKSPSPSTASNAPSALLVLSSILFRHQIHRSLLLPNAL